MTIDKAYCINLERRPDRWELASNEFSKHSLTVERFSAIDWKDFKISYPSDNANNGCTLSNYFLIERAKLLGLDTVMIFEDDVELHPEFNSILETALTQLPEN